MFTRRDIVRTMLSTSIGAAVPESWRTGSEPRASRPVRPDFEPVQQRIRAAIKHGEATGVAVAVASAGEIVWEEGFGWANRESGAKATAHTPFSMASITKPFTATTMMTLVTNGKLTLDESANKYLGKDKITGTNGHADEVTVRLLAAHVSGLPGMFESYAENEARLAVTPGALLGEYGRLAYPPGSCYEYSNIGFAALNVIASRLTGMELGPLMQRRVLSPLGLSDSFFGGDVKRLATSAVRYDASGHPIPYYITSTPASGELYASAHDLARFAMFNMKNHLPDQTQILDDRWIDELHKTVFVGPSGIGTTFGWASGRMKSGLPFLFKGGGQQGVATILYMVPSHDLACLVLTNRSNTRELAYAVCDQLIASYMPDWQQPQEYSGYPSSPFAPTPAFLGRWEGTLLGGGARMRVRLKISSGDSGTVQLGSSAEQRFTEMHAEGEAFAGTITGQIDSPDAIRTRANKLEFKLLPHDGKLVGRVSAIGENVRLPYVLTFDRL